MLKVGLTGGMGSGKTAAAEMFSKLNVPIIDSDVITHQLTLPGSDCFNRMSALLGKEYLTENGEIDRKKTAQYIFKHSDKRKALEDILHPQIKKQILEKLKKLNESCYVIIVIPLLFETNFTSLVDRSLVVDAPENTRINRIKNRDGISEGLIRDIIGSQLDSTTRVEKADDILDNSKNIEDLLPEVEHLHRKYLKLSGCI